MHGTRIPLAKPDSRAITVRLARDPNDLMLVTAIRSAVYLAEQDCPFDEEFDGNDMVAAHFIGYIGNEPAGCLRVRWKRRGVPASSRARAGACGRTAAGSGHLSSSIRCDPRPAK